MGLPAAIFDEPLTAEMVDAADALNGRIAQEMHALLESFCDPA